MEEKKVLSKKKEINPRDVTICEATAQMLEKAKRGRVRLGALGLCHLARTGKREMQNRLLHCHCA